MNALTVTNTTKCFKTPSGSALTALDTVSLTVAPGEIHGLLGPNGAGKSTLINLISGVAKPNEGQIEIFGTDAIKNPDKTKLMLGVVPQETVFEMAFTVWEVLYYFAGMYGVSLADRNKRIPEILEALELTSKTKERARNLSGGMRRRLMIAKAIVHRPKFLILDEPTAGVDVSLRQRIWELVRSLNREGTTILFTTHYLEEAEQLCERLTLINHGRVIKQGSVRDILSESSKNVIHFELFNRNVPHLPNVREAGSLYEFPITNLTKDLNAIAAHYGDALKSIRSEAASLEEVFLELTKKI